ncbi:hypothetical protein J2Z21_008190 [Streptomyces griseochromogenes]|uniref:Uncharacterized protein n=2 Tax=Streptomyces griseochromogenes TaxID=68214 RepID=A0ABS4M671_9ACTN|nr:hypothetical protein [Streptomyces griseochromogenes]MBP2055177.1 hypothetical protein [Streptomyces griseochromogenes]
MHHLRTATNPAPVLAPAAELNAAHLDDPDPVTREATTDVHTRPTTAVPSLMI